MSNLDQCPSTLKGDKKRPGKEEIVSIRTASGRLPGGMAGAGSNTPWRSPEELADTPDFRDWLHREFPRGASELDRAEDEDGASGTGDSRRNFLKLMGASIALAGAATIPGCRQPNHKIMPYSKTVPEEIIPGKPLYYATSMARPDGGAEGLLVETHEGRPTKIEGNPLHPTNRGKCSTWALSSIMGLYDPDRLKSPIYANPVRGRLEATWDDFRGWAGPHLAGFDATGGEGLAFVVTKAASPTRRAMSDGVRRRFPKAVWVDYAPAESASMAAGTRMALGIPMRDVLNISKATKVILSLDRDFLHRERNELEHARAFAKSRELMSTQDEMSRLYVVEGTFSVTGAAADHRLALAPSRVAAFAIELARFMLPKLGQPGAESITGALGGLAVPAGSDMNATSQRFMEECAKDLMDAANRGKTLIVAGPSQPPEVHALVIAMNAALGNVGQSVSYSPLTPDEAADSLAGITALAGRMNAGEIKTLICIGANPAYDAPGDVNFAAGWKKLGATITLSVDSTETASLSTWSLNSAHYLETWGDTISDDGTIAPTQPMIAPLYEPAMSEIEFLSMLGRREIPAKIDGHDIVREQWRVALKLPAGDFDRAWRHALHDGIVPNTSAPTPTGPARFTEIGTGLGSLKLGSAPTQDKLELIFQPGQTFDGRFANVGWLQELPDVGTRVVWDNPVVMSPATAVALGVAPVDFSQHDSMSNMYTEPKYPLGRTVDVKVGGRSVRGVAWILPGMADNTLLCTLGYGREACGRVGDGVGFNMYPLRASTDGMSVSGASLAGSGDTHMIASTQNHWSMEGRTSIVRTTDYPAWRKFGDHVQEAVDTFYGNENKVKKLNFAESMGELAEAPPNVSIYANPFTESKTSAEAGSAYSKGPQWGMTIDQNACTGCGACTIACQSENNIAVVGKKEVAKGREMAWIRVDRYFTGDLNNPTAMLHQPVACVQCENAPCETVCPVNATVHGPEGLNYMTYNRCIGTRYCANNCPYKVRRFNFFDYGVTKFNGDYIGKEVIDAVGGKVPGQEGITGSGAFNKINPNLVPPRLRQKLDQISRMQKNPDVTVRSRGVMEKCSYCVQRINAARIETKLQNMDGVPEGFFQVACQQACPSDAIVFGDTLNPQSRVKMMREHARSYALLGYLNTRPRTSHMVRVMNPNPALCDAARKATWDNPFNEVGEEPESGEPNHATKGEHAFIDRAKQHTDRGYALSLRVLAGSHA